MSAATRFQSLLSWILVNGAPSRQADHCTVWFGFQSLLSWISVNGAGLIDSPSGGVNVHVSILVVVDLGQRQAGQDCDGDDTEMHVSILVVVDLGQRHKASGISALIASSRFNPCCRGSWSTAYEPFACAPDVTLFQSLLSWISVNGTCHIGRADMGVIIKFQSLLSWISVNGRFRSVARPTHALVSILVVVDLGQRLGRPRSNYDIVSEVSILVVVDLGQRPLLAGM